MKNHLSPNSRQLQTPLQEELSDYAPPPRRKSSDVVRREFYRRLRGKPTLSRAYVTLPRFIWTTITRVIVAVLIVALLGLFIVGGLGAGLLAGYIVTTKPLAIENIREQRENTRILDADGNEAATLTGSNNVRSEYISISEVKRTYLDDAFIAIEDERFESHMGIDPKRILSAALSLFTNSIATHGGSTITQQTVKLLSGADQQSASRKVQEWNLAIRLERSFSKDQILQLYVNLVPMGNGYVGVQSASKAYFDKPVTDLSLAECAFLAGIPNRPSTYNPLTESGRRNALRRMRIILGKMYQLEKISESQYRSALNSELVFRGTPLQQSSSQINSYFVDYVIEQVIADLISERGYNRSAASYAVYNAGLTIRTTLKPGLQQQVEETFKNTELFQKDPAAVEELPEKPTGSAVVIENGPHAGRIVAMVGGFGEKKANRILNRAVDARRQPGSSIKPLNVFAPALDKGSITAASIRPDVEVFLDERAPTRAYPKNSYADFKGNISVREALRISSNTVAAQIWKQDLGAAESTRKLYQLGIDRRNETYISVAMGAFNRGMTVLEMAGAYATFPNGGLFYQPYAYTSVLDVTGKPILQHEPSFEQVFNPATAWIMTDMMKGVFTPGGTAANLGLTLMPAAGKTGTTDTRLDKWFCGYTPYYTAAVWYGYDNRLGRTVIEDVDNMNAILIWRDLMQRIHEGLPVVDFTQPASVETLTVCHESGMLANLECPPERVGNEFFVPNAQANPRDHCTLHRPPEPTPEPMPSPLPTPTPEPTPIPTVTTTTPTTTTVPTTLPPTEVTPAPTTSATVPRTTTTAAPTTTTTRATTKSTTTRKPTTTAAPTTTTTKRNAATTTD